MKTVYLSAAYFPAVELLSAVATAAILIYGGNQVLDGHGVTIGVLASFVFYLQSFFDPIQSLSQLYTTYQSGMAALDKIFELLGRGARTSPTARTRSSCRAMRGEIRFEDVTFSYGGEAPGARGRRRSRCRPGRRSRSWARPAPASRRSRSWSRASTTPTRGAC